MNITAQQAFRIIAWWTHLDKGVFSNGISNHDKLLLRSLMDCLKDCQDLLSIEDKDTDNTYDTIYHHFKTNLYPYLWTNDELTPNYLNAFYNGQPLT
jgi:hypothetical protein